MQRDGVKPATGAGRPPLMSPVTIHHFLEPFHCSAEGLAGLGLIPGSVLQWDKRKDKQWSECAAGKMHRQGGCPL